MAENKFLKNGKKPTIQLLVFDVTGLLEGVRRGVVVRGTDDVGDDGEVDDDEVDDDVPGVVEIRL